MEAELSPARVPYREKIQQEGQKPRAATRSRPAAPASSVTCGSASSRSTESDEMVFAEEVFGGSVPKNFFPAVEKGLREACVNKGLLAGYPRGRPEGHPVRRLLSPRGLQRNGL